MEIIENYKKALQAIYDHVGFTEDWVVCPIDETSIDKFWSTDGDTVNYADTVEELENGQGNFYEDEVYKQRFYDKWIYEGELFTLIFCNPNVDGMRWFRLFDNSKRIK